MEEKLKIFIPENKLNPWLLSFLILWFFTLLLNMLYSKFPSLENLNFWGIFFAVITFIYSICFITVNLFAYEPTHGKFSGFLIIDPEKIICDNDIYTFDEIEKIANNRVVRN